MLFVVAFACMAGLVMYANYQHCDPYGAGFVQVSDQVRLATETGSKITGNFCWLLLYMFKQGIPWFNVGRELKREELEMFN